MRSIRVHRGVPRQYCLGHASLNYQISMYGKAVRLMNLGHASLHYQTYVDTDDGYEITFNPCQHKPLDDPDIHVCINT